MREGSLEAPIRHPLGWQDDEFYDPEKIDAELRRVFDICHGCRRCFNLCDSFPRLFDLIDESESGELDTVESSEFSPVIEACTLCDLCFMTKCPYVPPHDFDLDFPHLMLRARAAAFKRGEVPFYTKQLSQTDRNGRLAKATAPLANWATKRGNGLTRPLLETAAHIHRDADLPRWERQDFVAQAKARPITVNAAAPAAGRKAVIYTTCFVNYNNAAIGHAARAVLAHNGVETEAVHPGCCGMPHLEHGDIARVAAQAEATAATLAPWLDQGYDVIALVPSCALMLKFEWPLILPDSEPVKRLAQASFDITEYIVDIAKTEGMAEGLKPLDGGVALHLACHARAQNMGPKAADMLRLIPDANIGIIERCSGHGGSWGVMKENFATALKVGKPAARQAAEKADPYLASECPLAGPHIAQGIEQLGGDKPIPKPRHPVQLLAMAYGLDTP